MNEVPPRHLLERVSIEPGMEVLDIATGTGNVAIRAAQLGARVTGLDLTPELFERGRERAAEAGVEIDWVQGDAEDLPFEDGRFDVVLSTFGIQFAPRHEAAAQEAARVTRDGGTIGLINWTPQSHIGQVLKTVGSRLPKPPDYASPPPLWGYEAHVRELFAPTRRGAGVRAGPEPVRRLRLARGLGRVHGDELRPAHHRTPRSWAPTSWDEVHRELIDLTTSLDQGVPGALHVDSEYLLTLGSAPAARVARRYSGIHSAHAMSRAGPVTILAADPHGPAETERRRAAAAAHGGRWLEGEARRALARLLRRPGRSVVRQADPARRRVSRPAGPSASRWESTLGAELVAAGLCDHAEPGQVLVAARRAVARGRPRGYEFSELGPIELDGLGAAARVGAALAGAGAEDEDPALRPARARARRPRPRRRLPGGQAGALLALPARAPRAHRRPRRADRRALAGVAAEGPAGRPAGAALARLRRAPAPATLEGKERLRLSLPEPVWLDVEEATLAIADARAAARGAAWQSAREHAEAAIELLRPGFLPDDEASG